MSRFLVQREAAATWDGAQLRAEISTKPNGKDVKDRSLTPGWWSESLKRWCESAQKGHSVGVVLHIERDGRNLLRLASEADPDHVAAAEAHPGVGASERESAETADDAAHRESLIKTHGGFRNPYTFIPALPRNGLPPGLRDAEQDGRPGHDRYRDDEWAGTLTVRLTCRTPLLLPDSATADKDSDGHLTYTTRIGPDGKPAMHGASLKGALRSAYEAVTASRFGVFGGHQLPLAYRRRPRQALGLVPARVEDRDGRQVFRLCRGDKAWSGRHLNKSNTRGEITAMAAAWVPAYDPARPVRVGQRPLTDLHGAEVGARVRLYQDSRGFLVWIVTHLTETEGELPVDPVAFVESTKSGSRRTLVGEETERIVRGWLSVTGRSNVRKKYERLFVATDSDDVVEVTEEARTFWRAGLAAYDDAVANGSSTVAQKLERSRHVPSTPELRCLPSGTLVYLELKDGDREGAAQEVTGVHPVMIGRQPFESAPGELLDRSLRPARQPSELSPADRVFGWVSQEGSGQGRAVGWRSRITVDSVRCESEDWRVDHTVDGGGVDLFPLSSPKPTQFRFYASPPAKARSLRRAVSKKDGYRSGGGLRGRKAYWWPSVEPDYWEPSGGPPPQGRHREYLLPDSAQELTRSQYATHRDWVAEGTVFTAVLRVNGLRDAELGPLIWLLTRGDGHALRLGGGKPLGFGAVTAELVSSRMWLGAQLRAGWLRLGRPESAPDQQLVALADTFDSEAKTYPALSAARDAVLATGKATVDAIHYPRIPKRPTTKSYEWFVENEAESGGSVTHGFALPSATANDPRLPYLGDQKGRAERPSASKGNSGRHASGRPRGGHR